VKIEKYILELVTISAVAAIFIYISMNAPVQAGEIQEKSCSNKVTLVQNQTKGTWGFKLIQKCGKDNTVAYCAKNKDNTDPLIQLKINKICNGNN